MSFHISKAYCYVNDANPQLMHTLKNRAIAYNVFFYETLYLIINHQHSLADSNQQPSAPMYYNDTIDHRKYKELMCNLPPTLQTVKNHNGGNCISENWSFHKALYLRNNHQWPSAPLCYNDAVVHRLWVLLSY